MPFSSRVFRVFAIPRLSTAAILLAGTLWCSAGGGHASDDADVRYRARLSARDHLNSQGEALTKFEQILRQDRANYHKRIHRDPEDQGEQMFAHPGNREVLEKLARQAKIPAGLRRSIVHGNPLIEVAVVRGPPLWLPRVTVREVAVPGGSTAVEPGAGAVTAEASEGGFSGTLRVWPDPVAGIVSETYTSIDETMRKDVVVDVECAFVSEGFQYMEIVYRRFAKERHSIAIDTKGRVFFNHLQGSRAIHSEQVARIGRVAVGERLDLRLLASGSNIVLYRDGAPVFGFYYPSDLEGATGLLLGMRSEDAQTRPELRVFSATVKDPMSGSPAGESLHDAPGIFRGFEEVEPSGFPPFEAEKWSGSRRLAARKDETEPAGRSVRVISNQSPGYHVGAVDVSAGRRLIATGSSGKTLTVWDLRSRSPVFGRDMPGFIESVHFVNGDRWIAVSGGFHHKWAGGRDFARIYEVDTGRLVRVLASPEHPEGAPSEEVGHPLREEGAVEPFWRERGHHLEVSADGRMLVGVPGPFVCAEHFHVWDLDRPADPPRQFRVPGKIHGGGLHLSRDGREAVLRFGEDEDGEWLRWKLETGEISQGRDPRPVLLEKQIGNMLGSELVAWSADDSMVVASTRDGSLWTIDRAEDAVVPRKWGGQMLASVSLASSHEGRYLATWDCPDSGDDAHESHVLIWDLQQLEVYRPTVPKGWRVAALALHPSESWMVWDLESRRGRRWRTELRRFDTGELLRTLQGERTGPPDAIRISDDGSVMGMMSEQHPAAEKSLSLWELETGEPLRAPPGGDLFALSRDGIRLAVANHEECRIYRRDENGFRPWKTVVDPQGYVFSPSSLVFHQGGRYLLLTETFHRPGGHVTEFDLGTGEMRSVFSVRPRCAFYIDHEQRLCGGLATDVGRWIGPVDFSRKTMNETPGGYRDDATASFRGGGFEPFVHSGDGRFFFVARENGFVEVFRFEGNVPPSLMARLVPLRSGDYVFLLPGGAYAGSPGGVATLSFSQDGKIYPFEQFDLGYNRPDQVAAAFDARDEFVQTLESLYRFRVGRGADSTGALGEMLGDLPVTKIVNRDALPLSSRDVEVGLDVEVSAESRGVESLVVSVNGVPVSGRHGRVCRIPPGDRRTERIGVQLSPGENRIEVSARTPDGIEGLRSMIRLRGERSGIPRKLHVYCVGVGAYRDSRLPDLEFAVADARDLGSLFEQQHGSLFDEIEIVRLFDEHATREEILALRRKMEGTHVGDQVILFFAGHGIRDETGTFWFLTSDCSLDDPSLRGVSLPEIEGLYDGVPARKRLLLIDTCQAGEVGSDSVDNRLFDTFFPDIRKGSGIAVLASSTAETDALEFPDLANGVFTEAVLEGLDSPVADRNGDEEVTVSELREYVGERVPELSKGLQSPTTRGLNGADDFAVLRIRESPE